MNTFLQRYKDLNNRVVALMKNTNTIGEGYFSAWYYKTNDLPFKCPDSPELIPDWYIPREEIDSHVDFFTTIENILSPYSGKNVCNREIRHFDCKRWKDDFYGDIFWFYLIVWDSAIFCEMTISFKVRLP